MNPKYIKISHNVGLKWNYFWLSFYVSHSSFWLILIFEAIKFLLYIKFMFVRVLQTENANVVSVNIIPHNISTLFWFHSK